MNKIQEATKEYLMDDLPQFRAGDRITIDYRVIEGGKERIQKFQGDVISKKGGNVEASFTVRKISGGVGVDRIFPLHSPMIAKIKVLRDRKFKELIEIKIKYQIYRNNNKNLNNNNLDKL